MPPDQREAVDLIRRRLLSDGLRLDQALCIFAEVAEQAGVEWRVLKGMATGQLLYPSPSRRQSGDVDVAVRVRDFHEVCRRLSTSEAIDKMLPLQGPATSAMSMSATFLTADGVEIDIHRGVQPNWPGGTISEGALFADPIGLSLGGTAALSPARPILVLHGLLHLSAGKAGCDRLAPLSTLQDLLSAADKWNGDFQEALRVAHASGASVPAGWGAAVAASWSASPAQSLNLTVEHSARLFDYYLRVHGAQSVTKRLLAPGRAVRLYEAVWPSKEYLEWCEEGRWARIRGLL